jgi:hypothetical protein
MMKFFFVFFSGFRACFSRRATFTWFVAIVIGLMIRHDRLGVTSIIRSLFLLPNYEPMINYFRSSSWELEALEAKWCDVVKGFAPLATVNGAAVMVGDGVKQSKEGKRMPGVKKLHQESDDSSKAEYIFGHHFGGVGILAETGAGKDFCIPLAAELQDGAKTVFSWDGEAKRQDSHVVEMIRLACRMARRFGNSYLLLDRLFLTVPALSALSRLNSKGDVKVNIVTKAKRNCVAYREPEGRTGRRGRPKAKGEKVNLIEYFNSGNCHFEEADMTLYGKAEHVKYVAVDLLWGKGLYQKLRFVHSEYGGRSSVLVSTDIELHPLEIVRLYSRRFAIESMFREMKQVTSAFGYRFWSKRMPRLNRFRRKSDPDPLEGITDAGSRERLRLAVKAIEGYVFCCAVATGLLQMISMKLSAGNRMPKVRYMRTPTRSALSEATVADYLRKNIFALLQKHADLGITSIIRSKQMDLDDQFEYFDAS